MKTIYKFIPYEKLTLICPYRSKEVLDLIADKTEMDRSLKRQFLERIKMRSDYMFEGKITDKGFEITRIIFYRNSFLPVMIGEVRDQSFGSEIDLTLRMNWLVIIFGIVWMGVISMICISLLFTSLFAWNFDSLFMMPFGMWFFGAILFWGGFKFESIRSRNGLMNLLNAQEKEEYF
jgi:hypothetical protein